MMIMNDQLIFDQMRNETKFVLEWAHSGVHSGGYSGGDSGGYSGGQFSTL